MSIPRAISDEIHFEQAYILNMYEEMVGMGENTSHKGSLSSQRDCLSLDEIVVRHLWTGCGFSPPSGWVTFQP